MTLAEAIDHVRQNIAEKLSGDTVLTQTAFLTDVFNLHVIPHLVTTHDWSWKYRKLDQTLAIGTHTFTPDISGLGANVILDDLYAIVLRTGNRSTTKVIHGRDLKWFIDQFPAHDLNESGRPEWFTTIGSSSDAPGNVFEVWLSQPLDAEYAVSLILLRTFGASALDVELPIRSDKHMLLVAGATSYAFTAMEQFESAKPWLDLFVGGMELWWMQDQARAHVETRVGRYVPGGGRANPSDYWSNPFIKGIVTE